MMFSAFVVSVLASSARLVSADAFLRSTPSDPSAFINTHEVKQSLLSIASTVSGLHDIENHLLPIFTALPKGQDGKLEPATVRYALHRYFVQKNGWYMNGLAATGAATNASSASILKDRAPLYIQNLFTRHSHGRGLDLRDLTVFVSILSDLVHKEAAGGLLDVFTAMQLPTAGYLSREEWQGAIKAYIVQYLVGSRTMGILSERKMDEEAVEKYLASAYPAWEDTYMFVKDLHAVDDLAQQSHRNPFVEGHFTFDDAARFVQEFGHNFGSFQNLECKAMKNALLAMEYQGTGRVQLSRFYAGGLDGKFVFKEHIEYLRHLGALDETDPSRPSVVIANYVTSASNCLVSSGFYRVCCVDECEGLLRHLEEGIAAPFAASSRIIELVSALPSETVDAPRNISAALASRLDDIAKLHGGSVPLHGRLFAQWMHHAYPRECPFPQVGAVAQSMVPEQWVSAYGAVSATREQMRKHADSHQEEDTATTIEVALEALPWSDVEVLLSDEDEEGRPFIPQFRMPLRLVVACAVLVSFAIPLVRTAAVGRSKSSGEKVEKCLV